MGKFMKCLCTPTENSLLHDGYFLALAPEIFDYLHPWKQLSKLL